MSSRRATGTRVFTKRTRQLLKQRYEAGASLRELALEFGSSASTIGGTLRNMGVQMRRPGFTPEVQAKTVRVRMDRKIMERLMEPTTPRLRAHQKEREAAQAIPPEQRTMKQARLAANLTQLQVADQLGIHSGHYSRLESGERPLDAHLDTLREILGEFVLPARVSEVRRDRSRSTTQLLLEQEARASIAIDADPRMQTYSVDPEEYVDPSTLPPESFEPVPRPEPVEDEECIDYGLKPAHGPHVWEMPLGKGERQCPGKPVRDDDYTPEAVERTEELKDSGTTVDPKQFTAQQVKTVIDQVQWEIDRTSDEAISEILRQGHPTEPAPTSEQLKDLLKENDLLHEQNLSLQRRVDDLVAGIKTTAMVAREGTEAETVHEIVEYINHCIERWYPGHPEDPRAIVLGMLAEAIDAGRWHSWRKQASVSNPELWV